MIRDRLKEAASRRVLDDLHLFVHGFRQRQDHGIRARRQDQAVVGDFEPTLCVHAAARAMADNPSAAVLPTLPLRVPVWIGDGS